METTVAAHTVRIHIDRQEYQSPDPTTGKALYDLSGLGKKRELFREVQGDEEDQFIPEDDTVIDVKKYDHFYSEKEISIYVNTIAKQTVKTRLTFNELVALAFNPIPTGPNIMFTIEYSEGPKKNPSGSLLEGESVRIKQGMIFDVTTTDRS